MRKSLNKMARPPAAMSLAQDLAFPTPLWNASCRLPSGSKVFKILGLFGKARGSKISEIFGAAMANKYLEDF